MGFRLSLTNRKKQTGHAAAEVARYYDEWTARYLSVAGNIIQAYRPADDSVMLDYLMESMGLREGMWLLDAGCGVGGPAMHFASRKDVRIEGVTISREQVNIGNGLIRDAGLERKVRLHEGDYHDLKPLFPGAKFDGIFFLEAFGHSYDVPAAFESCGKVLRQGGFLYVKDFFMKESHDPAVQEKIRLVKKKVDENYAYNSLFLSPFLAKLRSGGFRLEWVRRPAFENDIRTRIEFERQNHINNFGDITPFEFADWFEILAIRE